MAEQETDPQTGDVIIFDGVLDVDKETKGAVRFADEDDASAVPTVYVRKDGLHGNHTDPVHVRITRKG